MERLLKRLNDSFFFFFFQAHCCLIRKVLPIHADSVSFLFCFFVPSRRLRWQVGKKKRAVMFREKKKKKKVEKLLCQTSFMENLGKQPEQELLKFNKDTGKLISSPGTCVVCRLKAAGGGVKSKRGVRK